MIKVNEDGIKLYPDGFNTFIAYFDDWLKYCSEYEMEEEELKNYLYCDKGLEEEEVIEIFNELEEEFYEYCDEYGYQGETV